MRSVVAKRSTRILAERATVSVQVVPPRRGRRRTAGDFIFVGDAVDVTLHFLPRARRRACSTAVRAWPGHGSTSATPFFSSLGRPPNIEFVDMPAQIREKYQYFTRPTWASCGGPATRPRSAPSKKASTSTYRGYLDQKGPVTSAHLRPAQKCSATCFPATRPSPRSKTTSCPPSAARLHVRRCRQGARLRQRQQRGGRRARRGRSSMNHVRSRRLSEPERRAFKDKVPGADGVYLSEHLEGALPTIALGAHSVPWPRPYKTTPPATWCSLNRSTAMGGRGTCCGPSSTSGPPRNVVLAATTAVARGMKVLALAGGTEAPSARSPVWRSRPPLRAHPRSRSSTCLFTTPCAKRSSNASFLDEARP